MGYDIHITRAEHWTDEEPAISAAEWLAFVEDDPELHLAGVNGPHFTRWSGTSIHAEPWFDWRHGRIHTKNPDPPVIEKAIRIAQRLGAAVQGDDGEEYLPDGKVRRDGVIDTSADWRTW